MRITWLSRSISISSTPTTAGLPNCRATSAAWLVRPPLLVTTPLAASMPCTSSGRVSGRTRITLLPSSLAQRSARLGSKAITPTAAPGDTFRPVAIGLMSCSGIGVELRMQEKVDLVRLDPHHRLLAADQALVDHVDGDAHLGLGGPLAVAGLQQPELALLDGELHVLHVAVVLLEAAGDRLELTRTSAACRS